MPSVSQSASQPVERTLGAKILWNSLDGLEAGIVEPHELGISPRATMVWAGFAPARNALTVINSP